MLIVLASNLQRRNLIQHSDSEQIFLNSCPRLMSPWAHWTYVGITSRMAKPLKLKNSIDIQSLKLINIICWSHQGNVSIQVLPQVFVEHFVEGIWSYVDSQPSRHSFDEGGYEIFPEFKSCHSYWFLKSFQRATMPQLPVDLNLEQGRIEPVCLPTKWQDFLF